MSLLYSLFCGIGLHAWCDAPFDNEGHAQRVCATCPRKEKRLDGRWRFAS